MTRSIRTTGSILVLALILGGAFFALRSRPNASAGTAPSTNATERSVPANQPMVEIGTARFAVELARDDAAVQKGLSGRQALPEGTGMLFLFPASYRYRFWMPDMHFPIDIIWIANDIVVDITEKVPPEDDLANPDFYRPRTPARYVLEINAGAAARGGVRIGDRVTFRNIE